MDSNKDKIIWKNFSPEIFISIHKISRIENNAHLYYIMGYYRIHGRLLFNIFQIILKPTILIGILQTLNPQVKQALIKWIGQKIKIKQVESIRWILRRLRHPTAVPPATQYSTQSKQAPYSRTSNQAPQVSRKATQNSPIQSSTRSFPLWTSLTWAISQPAREIV